MEPAARHRLAVERAKGAGPDVEDDLGALDAARRQAFEEPGREVEACRRGRDRTGLPRIDRLVAREVGVGVLVAFAADVRGQGRLTFGVGVHARIEAK